MVDDLMKITDDIELVQQIIERYFENKICRPKSCRSKDLSRLLSGK